jgi:hypothetical protein
MKMITTEQIDTYSIDLLKDEFATLMGDIVVAYGDNQEDVQATSQQQEEVITNA